MTSAARLELARGLAGGVGERVGRVARVAAHAPLVPLAVGRGRARCARRSRPSSRPPRPGTRRRRVSWESITASVPSRIALATSVTSARVGREEATIESSICVAVIDRAGQRAGERDDLLLDDRHLLDRQLDAEVAARDHHAVGGADDLLRRARPPAASRSWRPAAAACACAAPSTSSARRTNDSATMSTPIRSPVRSVLEVLLGHRRAAPPSRPGCSGPGARRPRRRSRPPRRSRRRPAARAVDAQAHGAVGEVHDLVAARPSSASPAQVMYSRERVALAAVGPPQTNVIASPGLSSTTPSRSLPMRSFGPGRSCRIATWRPARPAASRTRRAVSACSSALPWEKFRRATSIPASTMRARTSGSREAGPIVATIFVRRSSGAARTTGHDDSAVVRTQRDRAITCGQAVPGARRQR